MRDYFALWLFLLPLVFPCFVSSSSNSFYTWTTTTVDKTVTVDCDTSLTLSSATTHSATDTFGHSIIHGSSAANPTDHPSPTYNFGTTMTLKKFTTSTTSEHTFHTTKETSLISDTVTATLGYTSEAKTTLAYPQSPLASDHSLSTAITLLTLHTSPGVFKTHGSAESQSISHYLESSSHTTGPSETTITASTSNLLSTREASTNTLLTNSAHVTVTTENTPTVYPLSSISGTPIRTSRPLVFTTAVTEAPLTLVSSASQSVFVQKETVLPGASAVTIGDTFVSLGLSGTLIIGTNTLKLPSGSSATNVFTIGNQPITIRPTGFEIDSLLSTVQTLSVKELTVTPGGSPIMVGTASISLGQGGTLYIAKSTQLIPATGVATIIVDKETIRASRSGFIVGLPAVTESASQPSTTTSTPFMFRTSFVSIPSMTTWSKTITKLAGQTSSTILPIWPCLTLCPTGFNAIIVIPQSPLPPSTAIIPPPFTFPALSIGPNGLPTTVAISSPLSMSTPPSVSTTPVLEVISSTMTTVPLGFRTEGTTNTKWTANTWITTNVNGNPTVVPVLVGCPGCGGVHGGIILWNLPEIPWVKFQLPGFPGLPGFHLPCIKIFGIKIAGECDDPPWTDGTNANDPSSVAPSYNPSLTTSHVSSQSSLLHSTSVQSPSLCSKTAVSLCSQRCQLINQLNGLVSTSCTSAVCQFTTACSATATTSTIYSTTTSSEWICSATVPVSGCIGDTACSPPTAKPFSTSISSSLQKRLFPEPPDPKNEASRHEWFFDIVKPLPKLPVDAFEFAPGQEIGLSSAVETILNQNGQAGTMSHQQAVDGLYGCTVLVVATPEAIWMAHLWQSSYMKGETVFVHDMIDFLSFGYANRDWPSLRSLINDPSSNTNPLAAEKQPLVLMIKARARAEFYDVDAPAYPYYNARLKSALSQLLPSSPIEEFNYKPGLPIDLEDTVFGKVLVQYDPAQPDCEGVSRPTFRVWVQGDLVLEVPFQNYPSQGQVSPRKRDTRNSDSCPLSWGQSFTPYEVTATYISSSTYHIPTTFSISSISIKSSSVSTSPQFSTLVSTHAVSMTLNLITPARHTSSTNTAVDRPIPKTPSGPPATRALKVDEMAEGDTSKGSVSD